MIFFACENEEERAEVRTAAKESSMMRRMDESLRVIPDIKTFVWDDTGIRIEFGCTTERFSINELSAEYISFSLVDPYTRAELPREKELFFNEIYHMLLVANQSGTTLEIPFDITRRHFFDDWTILSEVTCTKDGSREHTCTICNLRETEVLTAWGHSFSDWKTVSVVSCTEDGRRIRTCLTCGYEHGERTFALGHNLVHHEEKKSCTEIGWEAYDSCTRCTYSTYKEIPIAGHVTKTDPAKLPTCMESGLGEGSHCDICGQLLETQEILPPLGHDYIDCVCSRCGHRESEGLEYSAVENGYVVTGIGKYAGNVLIIPELHEGFPVTAIKSKAFAGCTNLTSVEISSGIKEIESQAFSYCSGLAEITVAAGNDTYRSEGNCLIKTTTGTIVLGCKNSVIPCSENVKSIDNKAFIGCKDLMTVVIPSNVTKIGLGAFSGCNALVSITLPFVGAEAGLTEQDLYQYPLGYIFGTEEYNGGVETKQYYYANNVTNLKYSVFYIPSALKEVTVTGGNLLYGALFSCSGLTSVRLHGVMSIADHALDGCNRITVLEMASSMTSIGEYAFKGCQSLTEVIVPDSVTHIGHGAFSGCSSLSKMTLPFVGCNKDGVSDNYFVKIFGGSSATDPTVQVPSSLERIMITGGTTIGSHAFDGQTMIKYVTIPDSVRVIESYAFRNCKGLVFVKLGNNVEMIGASCFSDCIGLTSMEIPETVIAIAESAFYNCYKLIEVYNKSHLLIEKGLSDNGYVGYYAKNVYSQESERKLYTDDTGCVLYTDEAGDILVGYTGNATTLTVPSSVKTVYRYALRNCRSLIHITLPEGLRSIGEYAFDNCRKLTSIRIPGGITRLEDSTFSDCQALTTIELPNTLQFIAAYTFFYCSNLETLTIPSNVINIEDHVFVGCAKLSSVTFENMNCWCVSNNSESISLEERLADSSENATMLRSTYLNYNWEKKESTSI